MSELLEGLHSAGAKADVFPASLASLPPGFQAESEEALSLRYGRRPTPPQDMVFEFTREPSLLHQYYAVYEQQFRAVHQAHRYHGHEDEQDKKCHVLVARIGNLCVGGARLSVKTPRQRDLLPIEMGDFRLEHHFPELGLRQLSYGQLGRMCLLPEFRGGSLTRIMFWHLYRKILALKLDMIFGTAPLSNARAYRQNCIAMGLKDVRIHLGLELPEYPMCEEIRFYMISGSVDYSLKHGETAASASLGGLHGENA